jgi:hypothetical protein
MPKYFIGLCILCLCSILSAAAQQSAPASTTFTFKPGQPVWVEAYELPRQFLPILLRAITLDGSLKEAHFGASWREPIFGCGNAEEILRAGAKIRVFTSDPLQRPTLDRVLPQRPTLDRALPDRPTLDPPPMIMPAWPINPAPIVKKAVEEEIRKQKRFTLAASAEAADFMLWLLVVPAPEPVTDGKASKPKDKTDYSFNQVVALVVPAELLSRKRKELQALASPVFGEIKDAMPQKQQQLQALMKDTPWQGVLIAKGRSYIARQEREEVPLLDLIRCFHKGVPKK